MDVSPCPKKARAGYADSDDDRDLSAQVGNGSQKVSKRAKQIHAAKSVGGSRKPTNKSKSGTPPRRKKPNGKKPSPKDSISRGRSRAAGAASAAASNPEDSIPCMMCNRSKQDCSNSSFPLPTKMMLWATLSRP